MDTDSAHSVCLDRPQVVLYVHLSGASLPRHKVPVIKLCYNVRLSEKLF